MCDGRDHVDTPGALVSYRQLLEQRYAELTSSYDTTIVTLSGGALATSFAFLKDIVPEPDPSTIGVLWFSWLTFALSLSCALLSLLCGQYAVRRAIRQVDDGTIYQTTPGGVLSALTHVLTVVGGVAFVVGVVLLACFTRSNLGR